MVPIPPLWVTTAAAAPCCCTALPHTCMHAKPCSTCEPALLHCNWPFCVLHCCRYADEEGVSDDEDMLRAFWSEDDEGAPCLCMAVHSWLPRLPARLQIRSELAGAWDDCSMRTPHAARPPPGLLSPLAATAAAAPCCRGGGAERLGG
jgi:hypothetical protein